MSAEILTIAPASSLKTGDIFRPLKWDDVADRDYVVEYSKRRPDWAPDAVQFIAMSKDIFMANHLSFSEMNDATVTFRAAARMVVIKDNILGEKQRYIPKIGSWIIGLGKKALVEDVSLTPPASLIPLYLQIRTDTTNSIGFFPTRPNPPDYKITDSYHQRLA